MYPPTFRNEQMIPRKNTILSKCEVVSHVYKVNVSNKLYNKINYFMGNRRIINEHVEKIMASLSSDGGNTLEDNPILINNKYEIIDGQHRYEACKRLDLPIYVKMVNENFKDNIIFLNTNQRNWNDGDFANYYASQGLKPYQIYLDYKEKYKFITHGIMIAIFNKWYDRRNDGGSFKNGLLTIKYPEHIEDTIEKLVALRDVAQNPRIEPSTFKKQQFQQALLKLFLSHKFKFNKFRKNLRTSEHDFNVLAKSTDMIDQMDQIYLGKRLNK